MEYLDALGFHTETELFQWVQNIARKVQRELSFAALEAEELMAEGMVGLSKALLATTPEKQETLRAYAYIRVKGAIIDRIRKEARGYERTGLVESLSVLQEHGYEPVAATEHSCPEKCRLRSEIRTVLNKHINKLPTAERSVLLQHALADKTHAEIAHMHNKMTRSYTTKALKRAVEALRLPLSKSGYSNFTDAA